MIAAVVYEYENGDREFPKGVYMEFYDEFENLEVNAYAQMRLTTLKMRISGVAVEMWK